MKRNLIIVAGIAALSLIAIVGIGDANTLATSAHQHLIIAAR